MHTVTIYALLDPRSQRICYVGQTKQRLETRLSSHLGEMHRSLLSGVFGRRVGWLRELHSEGVVPLIVALEMVDADDANEAERHWQLVVSRRTSLVNTK